MECVNYGGVKLGTEYAPQIYRQALENATEEKPFLSSSIVSRAIMYPEENHPNRVDELDARKIDILFGVFVHDFWIVDRLWSDIFMAWDARQRHAEWDRNTTTLELSRSK